MYMSVRAIDSTPVSTFYPIRICNCSDGMIFFITDTVLSPIVLIQLYTTHTLCTY